MKALLDFIMRIIRWWFSPPKINDSSIPEIDRVTIVPNPVVPVFNASAEREIESKVSEMGITGPSDHVNATPVIKAAWLKIHGREPTPLETLYTQAIASLETGYGRIGQFGALAAKGQFNWGGLQKSINSDGTCPPGFALGQDQGKVCFFIFDSDIDAAAQMIRELTKSRLRPNVIESMKHSPEEVAVAMRGTDFGKPPEQNRTAWYEGIRGTDEADRVKLYANLIRSHAKNIGKALEVELPAKSNFPIITTIAAVGLGSAYWYMKHRG